MIRNYIKYPPTGFYFNIVRFFKDIRKIYRTEPKQFEKELIKVFGYKNVLLLNTGRASLALYLKSISQRSDRKKVIIPSYTCPTVAASVIKAGLIPVLCPLGRNSIGYDINKLEEIADKDTLAIVVVYLFGITFAIKDIIEICKRYNIKIIEDCAQALGSTYMNDYVGNNSDAAILSFGWGKNLIAGKGGALIINNNNDLPLMIKNYNNLKTDNVYSIIVFFKIVLYKVILYPFIWSIFDIFRLKKYTINDNIEINIKKMSNVNMKIGYYFLSNYFEYNKSIRQGIAMSLYNKLDSKRIPVEINYDSLKKFNILRFPCYVIKDNIKIYYSSPYKSNLNEYSSKVPAEYNDMDNHIKTLPVNYTVKSWSKNNE